MSRSSPIKDPCRLCGVGRTSRLCARHCALRCAARVRIQEALEAVQDLPAEGLDETERSSLQSALSAMRGLDSALETALLEASDAV